MRPFGADFDLRGRPPVYKTAALPIQLRRPSSPKVSASLSWGRSQNHRRNQYFSNSTRCMYEGRLGAENLIDGRGVENQVPFTKAACAPPVMRKQEPPPSKAFNLPLPLISTEMLFATTSASPWAKTPALGRYGTNPDGVGTEATSPIAYTPSCVVLMLAPSTGIQPVSSVSPASFTTAGQTWGGTAINRSKGISDPSSNTAFPDCTSLSLVLNVASMPRAFISSSVVLPISGPADGKGRPSGVKNLMRTPDLDGRFLKWWSMRSAVS